MRFALILLSPFLPLMGWYLYTLLKGILQLFGLEWKGKRKLLLIGAAILLLTVAALSDLGLLFLLHFTVLGLLTCFVKLILKAFRKKKEPQKNSLWEKIYRSGAIPLMLTLGIMLFGYLNLHTVVRTDYTVATQKKIREEGYRIVLIADVHFGVSLDEEALFEKCEEINATDPDLVVLCGDLADNSTTKEGMLAMLRAFGTLESELGTYFVFGNHDRSMSMVSNRFTEEELRRAMEENGIKILQDTTLQLTEDLVLIGREDRSRRNRASLASLTEGLSSDDFWLVLDHQPNEYNENGALGTDLLLSGHTHGGQFFPVNLLMELIPFNDATYGAYSLSNGGTAIVTSGFAGWNFPLKTAAPAEYAIIEVLPS